MRALTILLFMSIILISCEKQTFIHYYIDNQSSSPLNISGTDIIHTSDIDLIIQPNEKKQISSWSKRGIQTELFDPVNNFGIDMIITNSNGDSLIKDYRVQANWESTIENQSKSSLHEYTLIITDSDF